MTDVVLGIRLTLDGKQVSGEIRGQAAEFQKLGQAAKQANEQARTAADQYMASLRKQAETLGMTKTQTLAYETSQHSLTTAQRAQVAENLRAIEAHDRMAMVLGRVKTAAFTAAAAIAAGFGATLKASVTAATQMEQSNLRLEAVLKATGHQAGLTIGELNAMAEEMKGRLGIDDDALRDSMAALLLFGNVGRETFGQLLEASANMSKVLRTDFQSMVLMIGKAFQDPEAGITALQRATRAFTDTQKDTLKTMAETGRQAEAMTMMLQILKEKGFDKVSESMNQGLWGATNKVKLAWDDMLKAIGSTDTAKQGATSFFDTLTGKMQDVKNVIERGDWFDKYLMLYGISSPSIIAMRGKKFVNEVSGRIGGVPDPEADAARRAAARDQFNSYMKQFQTDPQKRDEEIKKARQFAALPGITEADIARAEAAIGAKFAKEPKKSDYDQLIASIREKTAVTQAELEGRQKLGEAEQMAMKIMVGLRDDTLKLTEAQKLAVVAGLEGLIPLDREMELRKQQQAVNAGYVQTAQLQIDKEEREGAVLAILNERLSEHAQQLKLETDLIGSSEAVREKAIELRKLDIQFRKETAELQGKEMETAQRLFDFRRQEISDELDRRGAAQAVQKQLDESKAEAKKFNDDLNRGLVDSLFRGFESGKTFGRNFFDALKNMARTTILTPIVRFLVQPITGAITATLGGLGIPGLAGAAAGGAGGAGALGGAGNLLSLGNSAINAFSGEGLLGGIGSAIFGSAGAYAGALGLGSAAAGSQAALLAAQTGVFGAAGLSATAGAAGATAASAALTAIPYVGLALAAISLLSGSRSKKVSAVDLGDPGGVGAGMLAQYQQLAGALGASGPSPSFGFGSNTGRQGQNPNFVIDVNAAQGRYAVGEVHGSFRKLDDATLQTEMARGVLFALQGSTLPAYLRAYFDSLAPASLDKTAIDNALGFATSLKQVRDQLVAAGDSADQFQREFLRAIEAGLTPESFPALQQRMQLLQQLTAQDDAVSGQLRGLVSALPGTLGITGLQQARDQLAISEFRSPTERFGAARSQLDETYARALGGDLSAVQAFPQLLQQSLAIGRDVYASGGQFQDLFLDGNRKLNELLAKHQDLQTNLLQEVPVAIRESANDQVAELKRIVTTLKEELGAVRNELRRLAA